MKKLNIYILLFALLVISVSCELDNYDGPNAIFYGSILDYETDQLVEQDFINGAEIEYIEHGFETPETQYMVAKTDGTFRNTMMFSGEYTVSLVRGNFVPLESDTAVEINGDTKYDFIVQPYIRLKDVTIQKTGNKVVATFKLDQTVTNNVKKIGLFAHPEPTVGDPMQYVSTVVTVNAVVDETTVHTLEIDLTSNSSVLIPGKQYFFRVGALIDASQAKYNYATAVRIGI